MNSDGIVILVIVITCLAPIVSIIKLVAARDIRTSLELKELYNNGINQDGEWKMRQQVTPKRCRRSPTSDPFHKDFTCITGVDAIIGGKEAAPFSQPWMAYIVAQTPSRTRKMCAGTVISDQWVISAGHCFRIEGFTVPFAWVTLAVHDISQNEEEIPLVFHVTSNHLIIHDNFIENPLSNDIALIRLPERIPSNHPHIRPACLPIDKKDPDLGETCIASGWGIYSMTPMIASDKLHTLNVEVGPCDPKRADIICSRKPLNVSKRQVTCLGDSGGPLIYAKGGVTTIVGVLSNGSRYCEGHVEDIPTTYMRVSHYLDWIKKNIHKYTNPLKEKLIPLFTVMGSPPHC